MAKRPRPTDLRSGGAWTVDDIVRSEQAEDWAVSSDGRLAAWVRSTVERVAGEEKRVANLWLTPLDGLDQPPGEAAAGAIPESLQLTRGHDRVAKPAFSPDGRHLAFLSDRRLPGEPDDPRERKEEETRRQLWAIALRGGEAFPVTRFDRPVRAFGWAGAGELVVAAPEATSAGELETRRRHDAAYAVEDRARKPPVRLYRVTLDGAVRRLSADADWVKLLAVAPDGRRAVVVADQSLAWEFDSKVPPHVRLVDLATGESRRLLAERIGGRLLLPIEIRWERDSSGFYFVDQFSSHPLYRSATVARLWHHDLASGETVAVELGWQRGLGVTYDVLPDGFVALLADGVADRPARYCKEGRGWRRSDLAWPAAADHAAHLETLVAAPDGRRLLYQHSRVTEPPQWFAARLEGDRVAAPRRLTALNPGFAGKPTGRSEVIRFPGAGGDEVEALLQYPLDWRAGERRPLVLDVHGGPAARDRDHWLQRWTAPALLWRQRGAFVLQVNYHGSAGYGLEWVESIAAGRYYELEVPDLEAGVDHLIARGLADPERLAVAGWSNGGILAVELLTRTGRYRAASIGAADVEWISDWANVAFGASFDNYYLGAAPWEDPELYVRKSPFFRLTTVTTPTIVFTGTDDTNVPPHQSWNLFRALQQIGRAEVRLVLFPGEKHTLEKIAHQRRKIEEDLAWLDSHLFGAAAAAVEAVRAGSPLQALLQRARAARGAGGALGVETGGILAPETVGFAGMEVGRFEVTRAQYAAFDPGSFPGGAPAPGGEDLPAAGVPFARARAYAEWLARATGRPFRLPTEGEAKRLAEAAAADGPERAGGATGREPGAVESRGNTLDRWAGYTPNPEDEAALRRTLEEALGPGEAPLLLPAGSFPGAGDDPVFDLDGNAAEWAVREDGTGVPVGPSADRSTDPRGDAGPPAPEYVGFRIVIGEEKMP
jgi:dipeptidyl aminopeptidase/acylaminoacyl peptidase